MTTLNQTTSSRLCGPLSANWMTTAARDEALLETSCLRHTDFSDIRVRPSLPQATRDHRDVLYYGATHSVLNTKKVARCVYNERKELYELRYLFFDTSRNIDRVDWSSAVEYIDADYSAWNSCDRETHTCWSIVNRKQLSQPLSLSNRKTSMTGHKQLH